MARPVNLHIGTLSVGRQAPVGLGALESSVTHHLGQTMPKAMGSIDENGVSIPEIRIKAHPNMGVSELGEHVANEIRHHLMEAE